MRARKFDIPKNEIQSLIQRYKTGERTVDIANEIGMCDNTLRRIFRENGVDFQANIISNTELYGKKFNRLYVIGPGKYETYGGKKKYLFLECRCDCGKIVYVKQQYILSGATKSCGCYIRDYMYKGYQEIPSTHWGSILYSADKRNLEFNISVEYAWELFLEQKRICNLSGLEISFYKKDEKYNTSTPRTASLDRIDSSKGYVEGNVQWLHKVVNKMKNTMSDEDFIYFCASIADYNKNRIKNHA